MAIIVCETKDEIKEKIIEIINTIPTRSAIKIKRENDDEEDTGMVYIDNHPLLVSKIFYLSFFYEDGFEQNEFDINKRIDLFIKKYGNTDTVLIEMSKDLIDSIKIERENKEYMFASLQEFDAFIKKNKETLKNFPKMKCYVGDIELDTQLHYFIASERLVPVYKTVNILDHIYYKSCLTALKLCEYLLHFNWTDTYYWQITKGINKYELIMDYDGWGEGLCVYKCQYGLYAELYRQFESYLVQLIFIDNEFVRSNLISALHLAGDNFIGFYDSFGNKKIFTLKK